MKLILKLTHFRGHLTVQGIAGFSESAIQLGKPDQVALRRQAKEPPTLRAVLKLHATADARFHEHVLPG